MGDSHPGRPGWSRTGHRQDRTDRRGARGRGRRPPDDLGHPHLTGDLRGGGTGSRGPDGGRPADRGTAGPGHSGPRAVAVPGPAVAGVAGRTDRARAPFVRPDGAGRAAAGRRPGLDAVVGDAGRVPRRCPVVRSLIETVRTGKPGLDIAYGMGIFEFLSHHPELAQGFQAAMSERTEVFAPSVAVNTTSTDARRGRHRRRERHSAGCRLAGESPSARCPVRLASRDGRCRRRA